MEPTERNQADIASQPAVAEEPQQTRSLEPDDLITDAELSFEARLTQGLDDCNWDELQEKYAFAMDEHSRVEEELRAETARLLEVKNCSQIHVRAYQSDLNQIFTSWSQTTALQDENRALKR